MASTSALQSAGPDWLPEFNCIKSLSVRHTCIHSSVCDILLLCHWPKQIGQALSQVGMIIPKGRIYGGGRNPGPLLKSVLHH